MWLAKLIGFTFISLYTTLSIPSYASTHKPTTQPKRPTFEDFNKKYEARVIWEEIDKRRTLQHANISAEEANELMFNRLDPTEELFSLEVESGDAELIAQTDTRRWKSLKHEIYTKKDPFDVRRRLIELMKQAIYQARNKMINMMDLRSRYKTHSLYKMGFLTSRTDTVCKTFGQISFKALRLCLLKKQERISESAFHLFHILQINERQLQHWFNIELLVDLIMLNDKNCQKVLRVNNTDRLEAWKFVD